MFTFGFWMLHGICKDIVSRETRHCSGGCIPPVQGSTRHLLFYLDSVFFGFGDFVVYHESSAVKHELRLI